MQISETRKSALYSAISEPIMQERIKLAKPNALENVDIDYCLFELQNVIWREVAKTLNIENP